MLRRDKNPLESETNSYPAYKEIYASVFAVRMEKSVNKLRIQPKLGQLKAAWTGYPTPINNLSVETHTAQQSKILKSDLTFLYKVITTLRLLAVQRLRVSAVEIFLKKLSILSSRSVETETDIKLSQPSAQEERTINYKIKKTQQDKFSFPSFISVISDQQEIWGHSNRECQEISPNSH